MAGVSCHMLGHLYNTFSEKYFYNKSFFVLMFTFLKLSKIKTLIIQKSDSGYDTGHKSNYV